MCNKIKIIHQTNVGSLSKCTCGLYVLQFNNVFLEFDKYELLSFKKYVSITNNEYWDSQIDSCNSTISRKIPLLTRQKNLFLIFNKTEFNALKFLLFGKDCIELEDLTRKLSKDHLFLN
tara:strand:- start:821 stop:1177 length:357 start_codon:yes stop_codon:yes gene_type:complete